MILKHYSRKEKKKFELDQFDPIKNGSWIKPSGGLWTSPIDSEWGWKDWCEAEHFGTIDEKYSFSMSIKNKANMLYDLTTKVPKLENERGMWGYSPDFEALVEDYDAIHLTVDGERATRMSRPENLYGWDCETVLIMNPDILKII